MAVLFPTPFGHILNPSDQTQMLQAFLNIENAEGVSNGKLSKADLADYAKKQFFAADPNSAVASYLTANFDVISKIDSMDNTIGAEDLVTFQKQLPTLPNVPSPVNATTGPNNAVSVTPIFIPIAFQNGNLGNTGQPTFENNLNNPSVMQLISMILNQMLQMLSNLF
jgi:hypothetical protein